MHRRGLEPRDDLLTDREPKLANRGDSSLANAGSPIQPRASDASVTPSWLAERYASSLREMPSAIRARRWPPAANCSSLDSRIFTMANSDATKKALARTSAALDVSFDLQFTQCPAYSHSRCLICLNKIVLARKAQSILIRAFFDRPLQTFKDVSIFRQLATASATKFGKNIPN